MLSTTYLNMLYVYLFRKIKLRIARETVHLVA